jgi:hypothetical protein
VDIRRGGIPVLRSNLICFGYSDGVVVGDEGKGLIEGNTIYGKEKVPGEKVPGPAPPGRQEAQVALQLVGSKKVIKDAQRTRALWGPPGMKTSYKSPRILHCARGSAKRSFIAR